MDLFNFEIFDMNMDSTMQKAPDEIIMVESNVIELDNPISIDTTIEIAFHNDYSNEAPLDNSTIDTDTDTINTQIANTINFVDIETESSNSNEIADDLQTTDLLGVMITPDNSYENFYHHQQASDTCAIVAQKGILASFGINVSEEELVRIAKENGWYNRGTPVEFVDSLLNYYGIPTIKCDNLTISDLEVALNNGERIIVAIDAEEVWRAVVDENGNPVEIEGGMNHAIWVTGLDITDNQLYVVVNDPGTPQGRMMKIPAEHFINAWEDSNYFAAITNTKDVLYETLAYDPDLYLSSADNMLGAVNPNQTWVDSHWRTMPNGTKKFIHGHWRTYPNHTVIDNLSYNG